MYLYIYVSMNLCIYVSVYLSRSEVAGTVRVDVQAALDHYGLRVQLLGAVEVHLAAPACRFRIVAKSPKVRQNCGNIWPVVGCEQKTKSA